MVTVTSLSCLYFSMVLCVPKILSPSPKGLSVLVWRIICWFMGKWMARQGLSSSSRGGRAWTRWLLMTNCSPLFCHQLLHELKELKLKEWSWYILSTANLLYFLIAVLTKETGYGCEHICKGEQGKIRTYFCWSHFSVKPFRQQHALCFYEGFMPGSLKKWVTLSVTFLSVC